MRNLTCIVCPIGCSLQVDDSGGPAALTVSGNRCPRGAVYAQEEIRAPKRTVTATCRIEGKAAGLYAPRRVPVKSAVPCPKEKIPALLADIYRTKVKLPVQAGDTIIAGWNGEGINIVAVRSIG